ncbi:uncharacterized protein K02A2.6-like [Coccinella septempunctata]|uniref:uncharacterized protein K02A2.6-like n=1 Tax=Coccinella septempunctata TaxID=41139 RepID=UPI001D05E3BC|nr:uncharacterized protein K02A2.6-like [Coccinella septempunctata]
MINGVTVNLQIDTASDITIISEETWTKLGKPQCFPTKNLVKNASGQQLPLISEFKCNIAFNNQSYSGKCYVSPVKNLNLLGIDWITMFGLWDIPLNSICNVMSVSRKDMLPSIPNSSPQNVQDEEYIISSIRIEAEVLQILNIAIDALPVTHRMIQQETSKCRNLQTIIEYVQKDTWPRNVELNKELKSFYDRRDNLSVVDGCLMFAERVVVPEIFKRRILHRLHKGHPGQERMKSLARSYVYWRNIDADIQDFVRKCSSCAEAAKSPPRIPFSPWTTPEGPWQRLHIDFAGPIKGDFFMIVVDAYSKWPEIVNTKTTTTAFIIRTLEEIFARFGNPRILVSDNASQFCSQSFQIFCKQNGIDHIRTAPYHPQSNGQVERFVDTFKRALRKIERGGQPLGQQIQTFLATYRTTPSRYTPNGTSPAEVLLGRKVRTTLDLLLPSRVGHQDNDNDAIPSKSFEIGDMIYCQVHSNNSYKWKPGRITDKLGNVMYEISLENSQRILRVHANQLKERYVKCSGNENDILPLEILMESFEISRNQGKNNVWLGLYNNHLFAPYFLPERVSGEIFLQFLMAELANMWVQ